jgi:hypothetical protein
MKSYPDSWHKCKVNAKIAGTSENNEKRRIGTRNLIGC